MTRERLLKSFLLLVCIGRTASGATILDIPSNFSPFPVNQSTYIAAVSWTSAVSAKNVTLSVLMQNAAPFTQSAKAYLTKRFGPGTIQANDEIAETTFSVPPSIEGGLYEITLFRDMYLPAGDCYLTIVGPQTATWICLGRPETAQYPEQPPRLFLTLRREQGFIRLGSLPTSKLLWPDFN